MSNQDNLENRTYWDSWRDFPVNALMVGAGIGLVAVEKIKGVYEFFKPNKQERDDEDFDKKTGWVYGDEPQSYLEELSDVFGAIGIFAYCGVRDFCSGIKSKVHDLVSQSEKAENELGKIYRDGSGSSSKDSSQQS